METINARMDTFATTIKNQHSFNKMLESQLAQLVAAVPPLEKGKILGQPEELESANLVDICRYPVAGIPTLIAARQDPRSYP